MCVQNTSRSEGGVYLRERFVASIIFLSLFVILVVAAFLAFNGDHGLADYGYPPCGFKLLTGKPCPTCGGTTAFIAIFKGRFGEAWQINRFATVFFFVVVLAQFLLAAIIIKPRRMMAIVNHPLFFRIMSRAGIVLLVFLVIDWTLRLLE